MLIAELMDTCGVTFGTSGARGRVVDMTDAVCHAYTIAFLQHLEQTGELSTPSEIALAGDYRSSTPRIMAAIAQAISDRGYTPINCGFIPSPAVAAYGIAQKIPAIMVTGSHIPDDRNGIKFNTAKGEILKSDELGIRAQNVDVAKQLNYAPLSAVQNAAYKNFVQRYLDAFAADALHGLNIGLYEHSTVARDVLYDVLTGLGATVTRLARSTAFLPVDTEAIRPEDIKLAQQWAKDPGFDAIVSADGDGDRPLISNHRGEWLRGDVLGILVSQFLKAEAVATPVSCNSAVEKCRAFRQVYRTRIGSPFVITAMLQARVDGYKSIVGYEANGGFLTGSTINLDGRELSALPTRDAVLPIIALLVAAKRSGKSIAALCAELPARYTASDRLKDFPTELSSAIIAELVEQPNQIPAFFRDRLGAVAVMDTTDGLRITFGNDDIVHLRPSGNAPEFRCYTESASEAQAEALKDFTIQRLGELRGQ